MKDKVVLWLRSCRSLAQAGLFYGKDVFDRERYQRIRDIAAEMLAERTALPLEKVKDLFCGDVGYQTPKIDTRAAILRTTASSWCASGTAAGPFPRLVRLRPVAGGKRRQRGAGGSRAGGRGENADRRAGSDRHNTPPYAYGVVKMFFLCEAKAGILSAISKRRRAATSPRTRSPHWRRKSATSNRCACALRPCAAGIGRRCSNKTPGVMGSFRGRLQRDGPCALV